MSLAAIPSVSKDLDGVIAFLQDVSLVPSRPSRELLLGIKKLHRATYSLIIWKFKLNNVPDHGRPFIDEVASDALQILPHALNGYVKTTHLLTRGIIENALRYVYFFDHPVEFKKMNGPKKWYMEIKDLFEYAMNHPCLESGEREFHAIESMRSLYSDLSRLIHGGRVNDLEMRVALNKIIFEPRLLDEHVKQVEKCAEVVNFLLCNFQLDIFRTLRMEDRKIILQTISAHGKRVLSAL